MVLDGPVKEQVNYLLDEYEDRLSIIRRNENRGLAFVLNYTLKNIEWDFYFRMDADDIMHPERIQKQMDFILANTDYHAIGTQFRRFVPDGTFYDGRFLHNNWNDIIKATVLRSPTSHATMLYKKSFFELNGYYNEFNRYGCEDYDLFARAVANNVKFTTIDEQLYDVRSSPEIQFRRLRLKNIIDDYIISFKYIIKMKLYGLFLSFRLRRFQNFIKARSENSISKIKDRYINDR